MSHHTLLTSHHPPTSQALPAHLSLIPPSTPPVRHLILWLGGCSCRRLGWGGHCGWWSGCSAPPGTLGWGGPGGGAGLTIGPLCGGTGLTSTRRACHGALGPGGCLAQGTEGTGPHHTPCEHRTPHSTFCAHTTPQALCTHHTTPPVSTPHHTPYAHRALGYGLLHARCCVRGAANRVAPHGVLAWGR